MVIMTRVVYQNKICYLLIAYLLSVANKQTKLFCQHHEPEIALSDLLMAISLDTCVKNKKLPFA